MNPSNDKITRAIRHIALALLASFLLVSCGGGGGGGGNTPNNTATISGSATVSTNTIVVSDTQTAQIASTIGNADGSTQLVTTPNSTLGASLVVGSIVQMTGGADSRFPLGFVGKVSSVTTGSDGVTSAALTNATLADVAQKSTFQTTDVALNSTNFVGVIAPKAVQTAATAAQPQVLSVLQQGVSALNGGLVLSEANLLGQVANKAQSGLSLLGGNGTIDVGEIKLTIPGIKLADMGLDPSRLKPYGTSPVASFDIVGSIKNLKLIENHDFDTTAGVVTGLKSLDIRVTGDVDVSVNLHGGADADLGYFSQAWKEVEDAQMQLLGVSSKLTGLDSKDKIGKYPIAGLVFAVPCPAIGCPIMAGQTQTPLRAAKAGGVIVWVYLTANGKIILDGEVGARLNAGSLNLGLQKTEGGKLIDVHELNNSGTGRLIEAPYLNGEASATLRLGTAIEVDFFTLGVRIGNASAFAGGQANVTLKTTTPLSYGTSKLGDPWTWVGQACLQTSIGAGAIFSAAVDVGVEIDTLWKKINADFSYGGTWPTEAEILIPGWHGIGNLTWYTATAYNSCPVPSNVTATAGDGQATLSWDAVAGATYNLYMASASGVTKSNYSTLADGMRHVGVTSPYTHTGLTNGAPYYYVVTEVNAYGESIESSQVTATPQALPVVTLTASPSSIVYGATSILNWSSTNTTSCASSGGGGTGASGTFTTPSLTATTIYTVTCTGPGGAASQSATVTVAGALAPTVTLTASPSSIANGATSTLSWSSTNSTSCTSTGGGGTGTAGTFTTPTLTTSTTYTVTCTGAGGTASQSATVTVAAPASTLNDTGITSLQCYQAGSDVLVDCGSAGAIALNSVQDGMVGRDANPATNSNTDGKLGFSFASVPAAGSDTGSCVQDNVTGLMWEVKTADGGLRDWNKTYTNYGDNRAGDASDFVTAVNATNLCGYSDWRLPSADELQSIVDYGVVFPGPTIDATWFPNTQGNLFWSASPYVGFSLLAWYVYFYDGLVYLNYRHVSYYVRLVRAGQ